MKRGYFFHDVEVNTLNELALLYSQNFKEAITDVFNNTKKLVKFIRKRNIKLAKEVVDIIISTKYQNNAVTFIIFTLLDDKRVVINGEDIPFKTFVSYIKKYGPKHKGIYAFIEDLGITRTYANLNIDSNLCNDSYIIEKHIDDEFVYNYLSTYYEFDYVESLKSFIANVFIYDEECFRRALKVIKNERFLLVLAHKVGFKAVYNLYNSQMPIFDAIKLLQVEFEEADLKKLISDTFYWWLLDNYDKYNYNKESKGLAKQLKNCKKEYRHLLKKYSFNRYIDFCHKLYNLYIEFINQFRAQNIEVKAKYDVEEYVLDKYYCNTYICANFIRSHTVKLQVEQIDDANDDKDKKIESLEIDKILKKQTKFLKKLTRFLAFDVFFVLILTIEILLVNILPLFINSLDKYLPKVFFSLPYQILFVGMVIFALICCTILSIRINKSQLALSNLYLLQNNYDKSFNSTVKVSTNIEKINKNEAYNYKVAMRYHRIISMLGLLALAFISSVFAIYLTEFINNYFAIFYKNSNSLDTLRSLYPFIGLIIGALYGLFRKRKGAFTVIFIVFLTIILWCGLGLML